MFVACGIWCLADVSSVSPSSEQTVDLLRPFAWALMWYLPFHFIRVPDNKLQDFH